MQWKLSCRVGEITLCARRNSIVYPPRESNRDRLCGIIDTILAEQPKDFEVFLQKLIQQGYEVKRGKHTAAKGKEQKISSADELWERATAATERYHATVSYTHLDVYKRQASTLRSSERNSGFSQKAVTPAARASSSISAQS